MAVTNLKKKIQLPVGAKNRQQLLKWSHLSDEALLNVRICDLKVQVEGTVLEKRIDRLYGELQACGLVFRPHVWLSTDWFSPDGVPGIALPFYLSHPRLMKLEKAQMLEIEGSSEAGCMEILRHEAGHAIDTAYRLHWKRSWQRHFGRYSKTYPSSYLPKPFSKQYVLNLAGWYAQVHPAEDFAETFAVWLRPRSRWRQQYKDWPALSKLDYMDELMKGIDGSRPKVRCLATYEPLSQIRKTLRQHYHEKRLHYDDEWPDFYDHDLYKVFSDEKKYIHRNTAARFLYRLRPELREVVADWTGAHSYTIDQILEDMIHRCRELKLRMVRSQQDTRCHIMIMVTVQLMNFMHRGYHRILPV